MRIKAIIFDVGGVLNKGRAEFIQCFKEHGMLLENDLWAHEICKQLIYKFGTGGYGFDEQGAKCFFEEIRIPAKIDEAITFEAFKNAWNATIICVNYELVDRLAELKELGYRLFILSDTNLLHREYLETLYQQKYPGQSLRALFEKCYFSHETGNSKGFSEETDQAWLQILQENALNAGECLFIDDKLTYVNNARKLGLSGLHYRNESTSNTIFNTLDILNQSKTQNHNVFFQTKPLPFLNEIEQQISNFSM